MKAAIRTIFLISLSSLLFGCMNYVTDCKYPYSCVSTCSERTPCGMYLKRRCAYACDPCNFKEHTCTTCWTCLNEKTEN